jgi:hypothetical protein
MKYRVRIDLSFENEADARALMEGARTLKTKAVNINPGSDNAEISYFELEQCLHDEGLPCTLLERVEIGLE